MKMHIIGCSGSGKTYLAKALSEKYKNPHFDLDNIQWDNNSGGYGVKMPAEKRNHCGNALFCVRLATQDDPHDTSLFDENLLRKRLSRCSPLLFFSKKSHRLAVQDGGTCLPA